MKRGFRYRPASFRSARVLSRERGGADMDGVKMAGGRRATCPATLHPRVPREISDPASRDNLAVTGIERNENAPTTTNAGQKSGQTIVA
jgi:hypothetical protein